MKLTRLREVRELHGWSQSRLAEESGVSRDGISNYETGHRQAWPSTAKKLADALGVEIADLVARMEEPVLAEKAEAPKAEPPQVSKERLEEHFENIQPAEVNYLDGTIADLWRLALPGEKPQAHVVPEDIDTERVWEFLNFVLTTPGLFMPEQVERINRGAWKLALAGKE